MFVALDLPDDARERLVRWRDLLLDGRRDVRPVRPEALHVTLVFLGWQDESAAERIADAAFGSLPAAPAPRLAATGVRPVPPRDARLFALDLDDEAGRAGALQEAISGALEAGGWYRPEKRPFWPHLTVARVRPEKRGSKRPARVDMPPKPLSPDLEHTFGSDRLTLYRSHLRPQGAEYEPLAQLELKP